MLEVNKLYKKYQSGQQELTVLHNINFEIKGGETVAIIGPSGSGKTTLLGLCAGLDSVTSGEVLLNGISLNTLDEDLRAKIRKDHVGFIFQNFQLIPTLTAIENVMVPIELKKSKNARQEAIKLLDQVGLSDRMNHYPNQLSGGEQQRVSIARAFAVNPKILFADEPTGNLDTETGALIEELIFKLNEEHQTTLVLVTHDHDLANRTKRIFSIKGGILQEVAHD